MGRRYSILQGALPEAAYQVDGLFHASVSDPPYELGFMNRGWDNSGVSFRPETWAAILDRLHPGAFGMAFGGSRTAHRIACAIEDAGAIIHPTIYMWMFTGGFPKATAISRQILEDPQLAEQWEGHRYGLQALRPAVEPIILYQKPYPKRLKPVQSITHYGAGALNIMGSLIPRAVRYNPAAGNKAGGGGAVYAMGERGMNPEAEGRIAAGGWPCNLVMIHRPECAGGECDPECPIAEANRQIGLRRSQSFQDRERKSPKLGAHGIYGHLDGEAETGGFDDEGSSELFFHQFDWSLDVEETMGRSPAGFYSPKAKGQERDLGIQGEAVTVDDGRNKPIDNPYLRGQTGRKNEHPTVKPLTLTRWLAGLLLPPPGYHRRLLVPFSGSGSEMIGGCLAGWDEVQGIELRDRAVEQANERLQWWTERSAEAMTTAPKEIMGSKAPITGGRTLLDMIGKPK